MEFSTWGILLSFFFIWLGSVNHYAWESCFYRSCEAVAKFWWWHCKSKVSKLLWASLVCSQWCRTVWQRASSAGCCLVVFLTAAAATHHCWWWHSHLTLLLMKVPAITTTADGRKSLLQPRCKLLPEAFLPAYFVLWAKCSLLALRKGYIKQKLFKKADIMRLSHIDAINRNSAFPSYGWYCVSQPEPGSNVGWSSAQANLLFGRVDSTRLSWSWIQFDLSEWFYSPPQEAMRLDLH